MLKVLFEGEQSLPEHQEQRSHGQTRRKRKTSHQWKVSIVNIFPPSYQQFNIKIEINLPT